MASRYPTLIWIVWKAHLNGWFEFQSDIDRWTRCFPCKTVCHTHTHFDDWSCAGRWKKSQDPHVIYSVSSITNDRWCCLSTGQRWRSIILSNLLLIAGGLSKLRVQYLKRFIWSNGHSSHCFRWLTFGTMAMEKCNGFCCCAIVHLR